MGRKGLAIALALLVVLGGVYAVMVLSEEEPEEIDNSASGGEYKLAELDTMGILYLRCTVDGVQSNYKYTVQGWQLEDDPEVPLDQDIMEERVKNLCLITSDRKLTDDRSTFKDYGLDPAKIKVELEYSDGQKYIFNLGDKHPTTSKFYFNIEGTDEVYTVPTLVGRSFLNYPTTASLLKMPAINTAAEDTTTGIALSYDNRVTKIVHLPEGDPDCYGDYKWFVDSVDGLLPLSESEFPFYLNSVLGMGFMSGADYTDDPAQLQKYGLDTGYITLSVSYNSSSRGDVTDTVYLGKGQDGKTYARMEDSKLIGVMPVTFDHMNFDYNKYKALDFFKLNRDTIDAMTIVLGDNRYVIKREGSGEQAVYTCVGKTLDASKVDALYDLMGSIAHEGEATAEAAQKVRLSSDQPYLQMIFDRNTQTYSKMTLTMWRYDSSFYLAEFADNFMLINKLDAEKLTAAIETAVASGQ